VYLSVDIWTFRRLYMCIYTVLLYSILKSMSYGSVLKNSPIPWYRLTPRTPS